MDLLKVVVKAQGFLPSCILCMKNVWSRGGLTIWKLWHCPRAQGQ
ncbi:unnamed protein product [Staurois parvus]|uniref:Uncharacterized protein n=1 Tax=Staurois parvus TaxID=386267 RepID=A0ABN9DS05_9NEOB|nr:unnamed protein product [Staurois parvus]